MSGPYMRVQLDVVHMEPGQHLTVWVSGKQLEIRACVDGTRQLFAENADDWSREHFSDWDKAHKP